MMGSKDQKKRQDKIMKQRRKAKERQKKQHLVLRAGSHGLLQKSRQFPMFSCQISEDWQGDSGMAQVAVARLQPDSRIAYGIYLIDKFCLGLKNTSYGANLSAAEFQDLCPSGHTMPMQPCAPELAHQMIFQAIDYAAQFGFKPQKDYKWSRLILEKRGTLPETYPITFGREGKPFYVSGPYDNPEAVIARLEKTAGPGNYDYVIQTGEPPFDDDILMLDDEDEEDRTTTRYKPEKRAGVDEQSQERGALVSDHPHPRRALRQITAGMAALGLAGNVFGVIGLLVLGAGYGLPMLALMAFFLAMLFPPLVLLTVLHPRITVYDNGLWIKPLLWHGCWVTWEAVARVADHTLIQRGTTKERQTEHFGQLIVARGIDVALPGGRDHGRVGPRARVWHLDAWPHGI
jgi:hypothetical protein